MRHPVLCDLDGVIWLGDEPIAGSAEAVARLRAAGHRVLFVTNFSFAPVAETERKLARHGIPATGEVVTSAQAAAHVVTAGERVMIFGGPGIAEAVEARGAEVVTRGRIDAVIVGFHRTFDGLFARRLGCRYAQVWSGVTARGSIVTPTPDLSGDSLADIADFVIGR